MKKLITFLLLFCAFKAESQIYQAQEGYGFQYKHLKIDSTLHIPTFCGEPTLRGSVVGDQGAIAIDSCNKKIYFYDPSDSSWNIVGTGAGSSGTLQSAADASFTAGDNPILNFHGQTFIIDSAALLRIKTNYGNAFQIGNNVDGYNYIQLGDLDINGHATQLVVDDADSSITLSARNLKMPYLKTDTAGQYLFVTTDTVTNKTYRQALPTYTDYYKSPIYRDGDTTKFKNDSLPILKYASRDTSDWDDSTLIDKRFFEDRVAGISGNCDTCIVDIHVTADSMYQVSIRQNGDTASLINWTGGGSGGGINSIVAGDNITVDDTDPSNPIVNAVLSGLTFEQSLQNQGSTAFSTDNEVDFNNHVFSLSNLNYFGLVSSEDPDFANASVGYEFSQDGHSQIFQNDSLYYEISNGHLATDGVTLTARNVNTDKSSSISITPELIKLSTEETGQNAKIQISVNSSNANPNNIAWFDENDILHRGSINIDSTVTLSSGTITVSDTRVKTGARIFVSCNTPSGTQGFLSASTADIVDGTSFIINSSSAADNSTVNYTIINE